MQLESKSRESAPARERTGKKPQEAPDENRQTGSEQLALEKMTRVARLKGEYGLADVGRSLPSPHRRQRQRHRAHPRKNTVSSIHSHHRIFFVILPPLASPKLKYEKPVKILDAPRWNDQHTAHAEAHTIHAMVGGALPAKKITRSKNLTCVGIDGLGGVYRVGGMEMSGRAEATGVTGAVASSITRPLNFRSLLRRQPGLRWSGLPFVDLTMIGAFLALGASPFLFVPGAEVDLVEVEAGLLGSRPPAAVLTAGANQLFFFDGLKVDREALSSTLSAYVANHSGEPPRLLLKMDQDAPLEDVFRILETARRAGFTSVHLAADERRREAGARR